MGELDKKVTEWAEAGFITHDQARAIVAHEATSTRHRIPVVAEALGYLGGTLIIAAVVSVFGQSWGDLSDASRLGITVLATALLAVGGWGFRDSAEPALQRVASLLMFLSVAAAALFFAVLAENLDFEGGGGATLVGFGSALVALPLWILYRKALQQLALFSGLIVGLLGATESAGDGEGTAGVIMWLAGLLWILATATGFVAPAPTGFVVGAIAAIVGGQILFFEWDGVGLLLGLLTSVAFVWASLIVRSVALLGLGFAAMFLLVTEGIFDYLGDSFGATVALFFAGVAFVLIALLSARLKPLVSRTD